MTEKTYLITMEDGTEQQVTVPEEWKVTFGPAVVRGSGYKDTYKKMPMALRFYESETKQRAIFTNVTSFRDMDIKIRVKKTKVQEKEGFMEFEGKRKRTFFQARMQEWIDPDKLTETPALPEETDNINVEEFDVDFKE